MALEADNEMATSCVVGRQFVSIAQYKELLSRASLMEWKLKAMENLQDLLRQKDQELRKCWNMIQQYQMALRKAENLRIDSVHKIAKISEARDRYGREQTFEGELDKSKGFCLSRTDVIGRSLQKLDEPTAASDVIDGNTEQTRSSSLSIVSATFKDGNSEGDLIFEGAELHESSGKINPQKFYHESGTSLTEDSCGRLNNFQDDKKMELISRGAICLSLKSNQDRNDDQRQSIQSPLVPSMSKDLLTKLMQQNARLKKALKDILSCKGTSVEHYIGIEELKDTIIQLRQRLAESTNQMAKLEKKIKTYEDMEQSQN